MKGQVLVLNQNYEPLNVCSWRRAVALLCLGKAIALEHGAQVVRSSQSEMVLPTVVRLAYPIRRPLPELKLSRRAILARDSHTCQYCGHVSRDLTIDHVIPRDRSGQSTWDNLVACCLKCNNKKGNKTPREADMKLIRKPRRPRFIPYLSYATFTAAAKNPLWRDYLEPFAPHLVEA
ncbi:HNH endonuclease [bacterium]|nr:HNH endonuclease [bacterium]